MSYQTSETRCKGVKPDGKRCKLTAPIGEYLCEHHATDLKSLFQEPEKCVEIMAGRYPKIHHPACDRKGVNDCECPDYSRGAQVMKTVRKAISDSANQLPLYRRLNKLRMRLKVKKIRKYYNSISEDDLWLPTKPGWRQFRFFVWDDRQGRVVVRVIKDNMKNKATLLGWLRKLAPLHVYYTTSAWLNPQGIGPDPYGRKGRSKFKKKGWSFKMKTYHNCFLWQELYFDVDYCNADYNEGAKTLGLLADQLPIVDTNLNPSMCISPRDELTIVFSGGKGFHLIDREWRMSKVIENMDEEARNYMKTRYARPEEKQDVERELKTNLVDKVREAGVLIDFDVTPDPRRIIRLPGTVHGKTLRVCKIISWDDLDYDDDGNIIGYSPDEPVG